MRRRDEGKEDDGRRPWIEIDYTPDGWHWVLWAENGQPLATSARPYLRRHNLTDALKAMLAKIGPRTQIMIQAGAPPPDTGPEGET